MQNAGGDVCSLADIIKELENEEIKKLIEEYRGFYFLKGRRELVEARINKNKISSSKLKKLRRVVWLLRFVPYVRMIAVTGTLSMKNAEKSSDWDLLIVLEKGKIWTGRTLVTAAAQLMGKRRHGNKIKDRICLNYFITTNSLEVRSKDLFSANEYYFLFPLFDSGSYYNKFQLRNSWIRDIKPGYQLNEILSPRTFKDTKTSYFIRTFGEKILIFSFLEDYLRKWEKKKIEQNPNTQKTGSIIEATDEALIFLPEPQGPKVFDKFKERLELFGNLK
jgi:predicted nucleotidyltransferase